MSARRWPVARQLFALQGALLLVVFVAAAAITTVLAARRDDDQAAAKVRALAVSVAANPFVVAQVSGSDPTRALEPYAEDVRRSTGTDFVVVMAPDRTRWTHPNRALIGKPFQGTIAPALAGHVFTETFRGSLGPSVRAVAPVRDGRGRIVALVSVGVTTKAVRQQLYRTLPLLFGLFGALLVVAALGAWLVARRLRRQTRGLDAEAIGQMYASHDAVLHSLREGLLVLDVDGRVTTVNDEARRLLDLPTAVEGRAAAEIVPATSVARLLASGADAHDELHVTETRVLVVNQSAVSWRGRRVGTVATIRDRTALQALTGELDRTSALADALHAQAHEAANRLHTVVTLIETGRAEDAVRFATEELELSQALTDHLVVSVEEPVVAALLLGKAAQARERGVRLEVDDGSSMPAGLVDEHDLVTVIGNLVDNAIDAAASADGERGVRITVGDDGGHVLVRVADTGQGLPAELVPSAFTRGWSTKTTSAVAGRGLGLALVRQVVARHAGSVAVDGATGGGTVVTVRLPTAGEGSP